VKEETSGLYLKPKQGSRPIQPLITYTTMVMKSD